MINKYIQLIFIIFLLISLLNENSHAQWNSEGIPVCTKYNDQEYPALTSDGKGGAIICWIEISAGTDRIYAQRVDASGFIRWTTDGVPICTARYWRDPSRITTDGLGGAIIIWRESGDALYAQRVDSYGAVKWANNGVMICNAEGLQHNPTVTSDADGGAFIVWNDLRKETDFDIYAQRINSTGHSLWALDGIPVCHDAAGQEQSRIVKDAFGGAIISWQDYRAGNRDIYAQRVDENGNMLWEENGVAVCTAMRSQERHQMTADGAGGVIIVWCDGRTGSWDIFAQRVDLHGNLRWTEDGIAICVEYSRQLNPIITADNEGGAIIAWEDQRKGPNEKYDIYAQRIDSEGNALWGHNGLAICSADSNQLSPMISVDNTGDAIITWLDNRQDNYAIYAQGIDRDGAFCWPIGGINVCSYYGRHHYPRITTDLAGGPILTWYDYRNGNADIYAYRVNVESSPVQSLLQDYSIHSRCTSVEIEWSLSEFKEDVDFVVSRSPAVKEEYIELSAGKITRNGLLFTFVDATVILGETFRYRVDIINDGEQKVLFFTDPVSLPKLPLVLCQNYPNPFNPSSTISYYLPKNSHVKMEIIDISGKIICCLVDQFQEKGLRSVVWNGIDRNGNTVESGIYFYRIRSGKESISRKMVILK